MSDDVMREIAENGGVYGYRGTDLHEAVHEVFASRWWRLGRRCGVCGKRSFRSCGTRSGETNRIGRGYYRWSKFNPCSSLTPGGLRPGLGEVHPIDDLDAVRGGVVGGEVR